MRQNRKCILGITGGVGCGKSSVLAYLEKAYHARLLLLDDVARAMQSPGGKCYLPMLELFGEESLGSDGEFDRAKIAKMVFSHLPLLKKLNAIVHPAVYAETKRQADDFRKQEENRDGYHEQALLVIEAALLLEGGYERICDEIWYIGAPEEVRRSRLKESRGYSDGRITQMMASQPSDEDYLSRADLLIDNGSSFEETARQIDKGLKTHGFLYDSQRKQR